MAKQTIHVSDLHCPACVMRLEGLEDDLAGVTKVEGSYRKLQLQVEYDEACVSLGEILEAIKELGYSPVVGED